MDAQITLKLPSNQIKIISLIHNTKYRPLSHTLINSLLVVGLKLHPLKHVQLRSELDKNTSFGTRFILICLTLSHQ